MNDKDIRWEQRFSNFNKAFAKLDQAVTLVKREYYIDGVFDQDNFEENDDLIKEGLIQRFEYTHELAWNVMKDYAFYQGNAEVGGSRDATREALQLHLIHHGQTWMDMIAAHNRTSHTYNEEVANEIFLNIMEDYYPEFKAFQIIMEEKRSGKQNDLFD